jgi:hypothetical protein
MPASIHSLVHRILSRLASAEAKEPDPWLRDDIRIARLTVVHAARGDAVGCSPHVLSSYEVLGLHPDKVWPAIQARKEAQGSPPFEEVCDAPKKPSQSVKLWCEKTNGVRTANSHPAMQQGSPRTTISVPMAAPSIAALYPNSDAPSSAKKRAYTYRELLAIVKFSGAPHSVRHATLNALSARGPWPDTDGPAHGIICVSLKGMMHGNQDGAGPCVRSTARWRARRACRLGYWRQLREANSWSNCPKCAAKRTAASCGKCDYVGRSKTPEGKANFEEFCRPFMYEIDIEKFRTATRPKELQAFEARTYSEYRAAVQRGDHANVTEMPSRKPTQPDSPPPPSVPPPTVAPLKRPAAEHAHRSPEKPSQPKMTRRECSKFIADMAAEMKGCTSFTETVGGYGYELQPGDPRYRPKLSWREALAEVCKRWQRAPESVIEALKFWGYQLQE